MTHELKVDQTAISFGNRFVLISNINVPLEYLETNEIKQATIGRIENFINTNYTTNENVYFEITATYQLQHRETGTRRDWVGSFNPRGAPSLLHNTSIFDLNFKNSLGRVLVIPDVERKLLQFNQIQSDWVFSELYSIIIHVSGIVPSDYHILYMRNLIHGNRRRTGRKNVTFNLP